jgi:hypothetical protein
MPVLWNLSDLFYQILKFLIFIPSIDFRVGWGLYLKHVWVSLRIWKGNKKNEKN